jgi:aminoglycoside 2''-phosphotransferase
VVSDQAVFLEKIRQVAPGLALDRVEMNREGLINDVVIVNDETVFRFPKTGWGQQSLAAEVRLLEAIRGFVQVPLPRPVLHDETVASHRLVRGEPLTRESLFRMAPGRRRSILNQLGRFLQDLHTIPASAIPQVSASDATRTDAGWRSFHDEVQEAVFPLLYRHQRQSVRDLFEPVLSGRLEMNVEPVLIHGDLAPYHILVDPNSPEITGVIDFGTAGMGDPAIDFSTLLVHYGAQVVDQMAAAYPGLEALQERARFRAGCLELEWALIGIRNNDPSMLVAHIGCARDYPPMHGAGT